MLLRPCHYSLCVEHTPFAKNDVISDDVIREDGDGSLYSAPLRGSQLSLTERSLDTTLKGLVPLILHCDTL